MRYDVLDLVKDGKFISYNTLYIYIVQLCNILGIYEHKKKYIFFLT